MTLAYYLYVDNSNLWIEGTRVAAVSSGLAPDIWSAQRDKTQDPLWRLDFGRLYTFAVGHGRDVGRAALFGSRPPDNDTLWEIARSRGFEPVVFDRNLQNKEKKIDTSIATEIVSDSYRYHLDSNDIVMLAAGDGDYVPVVSNLTQRGIPVHVLFWGHASGELRSTASVFRCLDPHLSDLGFRITDSSST